LTTPNPDVDEDMKLFEKLGLNAMKPFTKKVQPKTVESKDSQLAAKGENPKWTRPEHKIDRNEEAKAKAKEIRAELKEN
jgi:biotin synthase